MHDGAGATLVFEWKGDPVNDWVSMRGNRAGGGPGDGAGAALGISGDGARVVVGARGNDGAAELNTDAGHVRVYDWTAAPDGQARPRRRRSRRPPGRLPSPPPSPPLPPSPAPPPPPSPPPVGTWTQFGDDVDGALANEAMGRRCRSRATRFELAVGGIGVARCTSGRPPRGCR